MSFIIINYRVNAPKGNGAEVDSKAHGRQEYPCNNTTAKNPATGIPPYISGAGMVFL
jgi:hypothetical protein